MAQGFTVEEFEVLKKWSGWANSGPVSHRHSQEHNSVEIEHEVESDDQLGSTAKSDNKAGVGGEVSSENIVSETTSVVPVVRPADITAEEMRALGWKVKRIIDQGRVEFINAQYCMQGRQVRYCDRELSPECVMIVATES